VKRVLVFCSYGCWPTWLQGENDDIPENIDPATLPLRPQTLQRLLEWDGAFQATYNHTYPPEAHRLEGFGPEEFKLEHQALLEALQQELGPAYQVTAKC